MTARQRTLARALGAWLLHAKSAVQHEPSQRKRAYRRRACETHRLEPCKPYEAPKLVTLVLRAPRASAAVEKLCACAPRAGILHHTWWYRVTVGGRAIGRVACVACVVDVTRDFVCAMG